MPLLLVASITAPLVNIATSLIKSIGLVGVGLLTLSSGVIGVPGTEPTMLFAGFDVYQGHLSLIGIIVAGVIGDVLGATIAYAIGYYGRQELVDRHGAKLHISGQGVARANRWFDRWGSAAILVSRVLPFIRAAFPYAAGVARMPYWRFLPFATLGSIVWIGFLGVVGRAVGSQWTSWRHHLEYVDYVGAVVLVAAIVWLVARWMRARRDGNLPPPAAPAIRDRAGEPTADVVRD